MSKHMKRLASPRVWSIPKKSHVWTVKQAPGPHPIERSVPLLIMVRDMLGYCDTAREGRKIIGERKILIDGRYVTDYKMPVGFMDVMSIPKAKENFRALLDTKGKIRPIRITKDRAKWKLVRIENITTIKGGKMQLNLHDGRNILFDKGKFKTGDVLKIELPSQKILDYYPLAEGNVAMIIGGKHSGQIGTIENYVVIRGPKPNVVEFKEGFSTLREHVFVVGKKSPEITVPEVSIV
ncbi:MAG: 30S ribosomal protein S4e [Methanomassiliicoccales archaeon]|nr:MAG: 30S ribosomal protein S4e [Methanomassiliicoccales archaeon]